MGAYIGTHTMSLVDAVGPKGSVITFEPQPWAYKGIKKTLAKNGIKNVKVVNAGLSNEKGKLRFCSDGSGSSSICTERSSSKKKWEEVYDIPVVTLDDYNLKNVSIMKVDVEGHEQKVLEGSLKILENNQPNLLIEIEKRHRKLDPDYTISFLKEVGYQCFVFDEAKLIEVKKYEDFPLKNNFIFKKI